MAGPKRFVYPHFPPSRNIKLAPAWGVQQQTQRQHGLEKLHASLFFLQGTDQRGSTPRC